MNEEQRMCAHDLSHYEQWGTLAKGVLWNVKLLLDSVTYQICACLVSLFLENDPLLCHPCFRRIKNDLDNIEGFICGLLKIFYCM